MNPAGILLFYLFIFIVCAGIAFAALWFLFAFFHKVGLDMSAKRHEEQQLELKNIRILLAAIDLHLVKMAVEKEDRKKIEV
jgi:hypothetical protein